MPTYIYIYRYVYIYIYIEICIYIYICVCICICVYVYIYTYVCICIFYFPKDMQKQTSSVTRYQIRCYIPLINNNQFTCICFKVVWRRKSGQIYLVRLEHVSHANIHTCTARISCPNNIAPCNSVFNH